MSGDCTSCFTNALGLEFRGFLGVDPLRQASIELDFDHEKLRIMRNYLPPASTTLFLPRDKSRGMKYAPVKLVNSCPYLRAEIAGQSVDWLIDTGFNGCNGPAA